jgi:hypothetical protein
LEKAPEASAASLFPEIPLPLFKPDELYLGPVGVLADRIKPSAFTFTLDVRGHIYLLFSIVY